MHNFKKNWRKKEFKKKSSQTLFGLVSKAQRLAQ
jgi:hypothetical protein